MAHSEKKISGEIVYRGKVFSISRDMVELEDSAVRQRDVVKHNGGVCIVAITDNKEVFMVRQFRYSVNKELLEIPAGKLEEGEDPFEAAKRELSEETGCSAKKWDYLGYMFPTPGYSSEVLHFYLATDLEYGKMHLDDGEFLTSETFPVDEIVRMINNDEIHDAKTVYAILKYYIKINGIK